MLPHRPTVGVVFVVDDDDEKEMEEEGGGDDGGDAVSFVAIHPGRLMNNSDRRLMIPT